eukprot:PhF_6_TR8281/c1_g1_i5/m.12685
MFTAAEVNVADLLTFEQQMHLRKTFGDMDNNGDGQIQPKELQRAMEVLGHHITLHEVERLVEQIDLDKSGGIDVNEFFVLMAPIIVNMVEDDEEDAETATDCTDTESLSGLDMDDSPASPTTTTTLRRHRLNDVEVVALLTRDQLDDIKKAFAELDVDENGFIDPQEIRTAMKMLGEEVGEDEVTDMIADVDLDGNGSLDLPEFVLLMAKNLYDRERMQESMSFRKTRRETKKQEKVTFTSSEATLVPEGSMVTEESEEDNSKKKKRKKKRKIHGALKGERIGIRFNDNADEDVEDNFRKNSIREQKTMIRRQEQALKRRTSAKDEMKWNGGVGVSTTTNNPLESTAAAAAARRRSSASSRTSTTNTATPPPSVLQAPPPPPAGGGGSDAATSAPQPPPPPPPPPPPAPVVEETFGQRLRSKSFRYLKTYSTVVHQSSVEKAGNKRLMRVVEVMKNLKSFSIPPDSILGRYWYVLMLTVSAYSYITFTRCVVYDNVHTGGELAVQFICSLLLIIDAFIHYHIIVRKYKYIALDFAAAIPLEVILMITPTNYAARVFITLLRGMKLARVPQMFSTSMPDAIDVEYVHFYYHLLPSALFLYWFMTFLHTLVMIKLLCRAGVSYHEGLSWVWILLTSAPVNIEVVGLAEEIFSGFLMTASMILQGYVVGAMSMIVFSYSVKDENRTQMLVTLEMLRHYNLPP